MEPSDNNLQLSVWVYDPGDVFDHWTRIIFGEIPLQPYLIPPLQLVKQMPRIQEIIPYLIEVDDVPQLNMPLWMFLKYLFGSGLSMLVRIR